MPKSHITGSDPLTREAIQKRIKDELKGVQQGVDFGSQPEAPAPIPDIKELGLPLAVRKKLESLCASQEELGKIEREAKKDRDALTGEIKRLLKEHIPDDVPAFQCGVCRVARYTQNRPSFDKEQAKVELLNLGVPSAKITKAFEAATTIKAVETLRISSAGDDE